MLVGACAAYALWGAMRTLFGKRSRIGSCCAKGCRAGGSVNQESEGRRVAFLPAELLIKRPAK
jgi:hypothetical protein